MCAHAPDEVCQLLCADIGIVDAAHHGVFKADAASGDVLIASHGLDAVTTDDIILAGLASASRGKLKVVGKPFTQEYYGVGIKKGDTQLATKINNAIVDMIQDGSWENAISDNTKGTNYTPDVRYNPPTPDEGEEA